jgi:hypothetical protein
VQQPRRISSGYDPPAERAGRVGHTVVVGDDLAHGHSELVRTGEMHGVAQAQLQRLHALGSVEDPIVDR